MYKLITIDVDDTLLNSENLITKPTKLALEAAIKQGVVVTLATGRMFASAKKIAQQLDLNVPLITYQGSLIKNALDEKIIYERTVPTESAKQVFAFCEQHGLHLQVYHNDKLYAQADNEKVQTYSKMSNVPYTVEPDLPSLSSWPFNKMLIFDDPQKLDGLQKELQALMGEQVHITKSKPYFLEVLHKEGTKGHAVRALTQHYGCDLSEVIAVGDSWNDREMIAAAGLGVAMGNAVEPLKQIADYVTLTNDEDGVKHVIEKFILH